MTWEQAIYYDIAVISAYEQHMLYYICISLSLKLSQKLLGEFPHGMKDREDFQNKTGTQKLYLFLWELTSSRAVVNSLIFLITSRFYIQVANMQIRCFSILLKKWALVLYLSIPLRKH